MFLLNLLEKVITVVGILLYSDAIAPLLNKGTSFVAPFERILYYLTPVLTVIFLAIHWRSIPEVIRKGNWLWFLIGFALLSFLWSGSPKISLKADLALVRVVLLGLFIAVRYTLPEQLRLFAWTFGIAAFLSLCFGLFAPTYGVMGMGLEMDVENRLHAGAWRGIFTHKNPLGRYMTLGALVFLLWSEKARWLQWIRWLGLGTCILLIILSTSKSFLVILFTLMILIPCLKSLRWQYSVAIPWVAILVLLAGSSLLFLIDNAEVILGALGRDLTLTGRTSLWSEVWISITEKPWLGHGLGSFWQGRAGDSAIIVQTLKWDVPHAHNGALDVLLDLGFLGLLALLASYVSNLEGAFRFVRSDQNLAGFFPIIFLTFTFMANLTESSFFRQGFMIIFYVSTSLTLHKVTQHKATLPNSSLNSTPNKIPQSVHQGKPRSISPQAFMPP